MLPPPQPGCSRGHQTQRRGRCVAVVSQLLLWADTMTVPERHDKRKSSRVPKRPDAGLKVCSSCCRGHGTHVFMKFCQNGVGQRT